MKTVDSYDVEVGERFRLLFQELDLNPNEIAVRLGENNMKYYNILKGKAKPSYETIRALCDVFPRINANWLIKGQRPILHTSNAELVGDPAEAPATLVTLPLYSSGLYDGQQEVYNVPVVREDQASYADSVVIRLTDNSMAPRLAADMILRARPVAVADWEYLNSTVAAVLYRSTLVVRRIKENELMTKSYLKLYADSADAGYVHVKREDIKSIWQILTIIEGGIE